MPDRRVFLDPARPALEAAADLLAQRLGPDMRRAVVVTPVARAGRRLLERLADLAAEPGRFDRPFVPPRIVTVGRLIDELADYLRPIADPVAAQLAWIDALRETDPAVLGELMQDPPSPASTLPWAALAEQLAALHAELAGEGLGFDDVPQRAAELPDFNDEARWRILADIRARYLARLDGLGVDDEQLARRAAIDDGRLDPDKQVFVIAAPDLNRTQRDALDAQGADRVIICVHADAALGDRFDEHGCVIPAAWAEAPIPLSDDRWVVADAPADQADAVVRRLAELNGACSAEQITVGVCDERLTPYLEQLLPAYGLPVRDAAGTPVTRTRPMRLLGAVADWLDRRRFADLATLLRHPDIEAVLADALDDADELDRTITDWLTLLDQYYRDHLAARVDGTWLGDADRRERLARVYDAVVALVGDLAEDAAALDEWAQPIADLLVRVYGRPGVELSTDREPDRLVIRCCDALRGELERIHRAQHAPVVSAAEALRLVMRLVERGEHGAIPPEPAAAAIELLGPLELHLDDADALVITGVNEGLLPASVNADPFLPNNLRRHLGLLDNDRRYARDAYALTAILASRPHVTLISGRHTAAGDPLTPSRLVFATDPDAAARRVQRFADAGEPEPALHLPPGLHAAERSAFTLPQMIDPATLPDITSLSVTAFRSYIACPYRFYLQHVLRLERLDDTAEELDGGAFGGLAHDVLQTFGDADLGRETNAARIGRVLDEALDHHWRALLGNSPLPAVRVQIALLRSRLAAFARFQAEWAAEGWRITHTERSLARGEASITVDGDAMGLTGRIDRIDVNEATGEVAVFDYKTGDSGLSPDRTHRSRGAWVDLQLPLYRHLVRAIGLEEPARLGYLLLPRDPKKVGEARATWTADDLMAADAEAHRVIRQVRAKVFWPPAAAPPRFDDFADICGVGLLAGALRDVSGEDAG